MFFHYWWTCFLLSALSYKYVVEQQPIGREQFQQFCETKPELRRATHFMDAVVSWRFLFVVAGKPFFI